MDNTCATKYPIVFIHGIGYSDDNRKRQYWGRIPKFLEDHGARVYFGHQDPFGSIESNALQLQKNISRILQENQIEKVNLIAHSKGGLEARFMISKLSMADKVASLTTIATPHRGILTMDKIKKHHKPFYKTLVGLFNTMLRFGGGHKNSSMEIYEQLTADYMTVFNELVPDAEGVYYQSYAFDMKNQRSNPAMGIFYRLVKKTEGTNDGLVSVESAKWGDFRGVYSGPGKYGISHPEAVDARQNPVTSQKTGGGILDITDLYWDMVNRLKILGY